MTYYKLSFYIKKSHAAVVHFAIYMRITLAGKRAELSTGLKVNPTQWNSKLGKVRGSSQEANVLNASLEDQQFMLNLTC